MTPIGQYARWKPQEENLRLLREARSRHCVDVGTQNQAEAEYFAVVVFDLEVCRPGPRPRLNPRPRRHKPKAKSKTMKGDATQAEAAAA